VHYNSRSIAPLSVAARDTPAFYAAYRRFAALLRDPQFQLHMRLGAETVVVFDNQRFCTAAPPSRPPAMHAICAAATGPRQRLQRDGAAAAQARGRGGRDMRVADEILAIYAARGAGAYFGERVSMTEHACRRRTSPGWPRRASRWWRRAVARHRTPARAGPRRHRRLDRGRAARAIGARWLAQHFHPRSANRCRLHVAAKRYLCATDAQYSAKLSPASVHTLSCREADVGARGGAVPERALLHGAVRCGAGTMRARLPGSRLRSSLSRHVDRRGGAARR